MLGGAVFYGAMAVVVLASLDRPASRVTAMPGMLLLLIFFGFRAGQMKAEDDRLNGRDPLAKRRPPSL